MIALLSFDALAKVYQIPHLRHDSGATNSATIPDNRHIGRNTTQVRDLLHKLPLSNPTCTDVSNHAGHYALVFKVGTKIHPHRIIRLIETD